MLLTLLLVLLTTEYSLYYALYLLQSTHFTTRFTRYRVLDLLRALLATAEALYYALSLLQITHFTTLFTLLATEEALHVCVQAEPTGIHRCACLFSLIFLSFFCHFCFCILAFARRDPAAMHNGALHANAKNKNKIQTQMKEKVTPGHPACLFSSTVVN